MKGLRGREGLQSVIDEIPTVAELVDRIVREAADLIEERLANMLA